jgi:hypothetical protein
MVFMTDSSDHISGKTGLTLTITASKDGGAFASISPTVTERGSGWYSLALTTSNTDTVGDLSLHATATGADPTDMTVQVGSSGGGATAQEVWEYVNTNPPGGTVGDKFNRLPVGMGILGQMGKTKFEMEKEQELYDSVKKIAGDVEEIKKKETVIEKEIELPDISSPIVQKMEEIGRKMKQEIKSDVRSEVMSAVDDAVSATLERDEDEIMEKEATDVVMKAIADIEIENSANRIKELEKAVEKATNDNRKLSEENGKLIEKMSKLKETLA